MELRLFIWRMPTQDLPTLDEDGNGGRAIAFDLASHGHGRVPDHSAVEELLDSENGWDVVSHNVNQDAGGPLISVLARRSR